jgi:segregation and condensation protein B
MGSVARKKAPVLDPDLAELPREARWREWMGRVEAVIFASPESVPREVLTRLVGPDCRLDELIGDIQYELRARPYELVFVAGVGSTGQGRAMPTRSGPLAARTTVMHRP